MAKRKSKKKAKGYLLPKYQTAGRVEPFVTSDLDVFNDRNQAYQDSLDIFNSHKMLS